MLSGQKKNIERVLVFMQVVYIQSHKLSLWDKKSNSETFSTNKMSLWDIKVIFIPRQFCQLFCRKVTLTVHKLFPDDPVRLVLP